MPLSQVQLPTIDPATGKVLAAYIPTALLATKSATNFVSKTAAYTALVGDYVLADTTAGAFTITLPASPTAGDVVAIKLVAGTNTLTLAPNIDGGSVTMTTVGHAILVEWDGTSWRGTGNFYPKGTFGTTASPTFTGTVTAPTVAETGLVSTAVTSTIAATTRRLIVTATGTTQTLPAVSAGRVVTVKMTVAGTTTVTPASGTIDGAATDTISVQWQATDYVSDGTNWFKV